MKYTKLNEEILKELFVKEQEKKSIPKSKSDLYIQKEVLRKVGDKINKEVTFEVILDEDNYWISLENLKMICSEISFELLSQFSFAEYNVIFGKQYVKVTKEFLAFVQNNTYNPKYVPILVLPTKEKNNDVTSLKTSISETEIEYESTSIVR